MGFGVGGRELQKRSANPCHPAQAVTTLPLWQFLDHNELGRIHHTQRTTLFEASHGQKSIANAAGIIIWGVGHGAVDKVVSPLGNHVRTATSNEAREEGILVRLARVCQSLSLTLCSFS